MIKMVKTFAKALKGIIRPKSTKVQVAIPQRDTVPTVPAKVDNIPGLVPTRENLTVRLVQALQSKIDAELKAFLNAVEDYPGGCFDCDYVFEASTLADAAVSMGFSKVAEFDNNTLAALCAGIEFLDVRLTFKHEGADAALKEICSMVTAIDDNNYTFLPDVDNDEDLGAEVVNRFWLTQNSHGLGWLINAVDYELLGEDWRNNEGGAYTSRGYFQFGRIEF